MRRIKFDRNSTSKPCLTRLYRHILTIATWTKTFGEFRSGHKRTGAVCLGRQFARGGNLLGEAKVICPNFLYKTRKCPNHNIYYINWSYRLNVYMFLTQHAKIDLHMKAFIFKRNIYLTHVVCRNS